MALKVLGIAGYSGSGKTTLIEGLVPLLARAGVRTSLIKHAHHEFDIDQPGKDSFRARQAGCQEVLIASSKRWALLRELHLEREPSLGSLLERLSECDLVLVEGYKREPIDKLEVHRAAAGQPLLYPQDARVIALATDQPLPTSLPQFDLNNHAQIRDFIINFMETEKAVEAAQAL